MNSASGVGKDVLEDLLLRRWSCRAFLPDSVPRESITDLLRLAQRAPSWCNTQPWDVIITHGQGTERFRRELSAYARNGQMKPDLPMPEDYQGKYLERRRECAAQLYESLGIARGDRERSAAQASKNFELFGAPHVAIITIDAAQGLYAAVDAGVYVGHFLLAATAMGLSTIPQAALAVYSPFVRDYFGIPEDRRILAGISFGYADITHPTNGFRTSRAGVEEVTQWVDR